MSRHEVLDKIGALKEEWNSDRSLGLVKNTLTFILAWIEEEEEKKKQDYYDSMGEDM